MDYLIAALLGVIEGITEFLPISSTGHLLIAEHWLGHQSDLFNIVIQAGAIVAVTLIYRQRVWTLVTGLGDRETRNYALKLALAFVITAALGVVITQRGFKLPETVAPVAWALVLGGVWMIVAERLAERRPPSTQITWTVAIAVGLAQVVAAIFPGTSRSSATIFIALLAGTGDRKAATEFAFLVGIPTMFAASGYQLLKHLGEPAQEHWSALGVAFVASTITAFVAVKWLLGYIQSHRFTTFAVYRMVLGVALLLWLQTGG